MALFPFVGYFRGPENPSTATATVSAGTATPDTLPTTEEEMKDQSEGEDNGNDMENTDNEDDTEDENDDHDEDEDSYPITLQVGERRFTTLRSTLTSDSVFFEAMFARHSHHADPDDCYFVDGDPDLFVHILRYLRTDVFPLFYNNATGHDYGMYAALLGQATYFQITRLVEWLSNRDYEKAVKLEYSVEEFTGLPPPESCDSNVARHFCATWSMEEVYACPRRVPQHLRRPGMCGNMCWHAQGEDPAEFQDQVVLRTAVASKKTVFDPGVGFSRRLNLALNGDSL
jgi:BTB/POZ domain-containing protein KCTD9